ncbi:uncharacterized protein CELE_B0304.4 [Caenorhabditis elegans]|uniref:Uncharacterized protein B0304.4 n=1 Tax=Caenorhabditis elegans TaxID=6239 RepID=YT24_CAEEL|nr:Uncharacterized protein CELE_B0304.4 [Caenorhabditis elegans]Q10933.1 RecName: Full=Uncharacterized protein B0304.4 [Caenorhabditis elegans]CCD61736.1 Uncharacterized protein CELE_B0304.4 [Caenorhabditis elegans]|eukprot:NP_494799.1 Uncharacterized protein CELE_B0304.4 [Caenorhabditis elegans]
MDSSNPSSLPLEKSSGNVQKGKLLNIWSRCIAQPSSFLGSSISRFWANADIKNRVCSAAIGRVNFVSKCLKKFPEVSLSCNISASLSLNTGKEKVKNEDLEKQERCHKVAMIEYEIQNLERQLKKRQF